VRLELRSHTGTTEPKEHEATEDCSSAGTTENELRRGRDGRAASGIDILYGLHTALQDDSIALALGVGWSRRFLQAGGLLNLEGRTALVTGGAGFIGSTLVEELLHRNVRVVVLDSLLHGEISNLAEVLQDITFVHGDVRDDRLVGQLYKEHRVDLVYHLAGQTSVPGSVGDPQTDFAINATGTCNVLNAARSHGAERFLYLSSAAAYGEANRIPATETEPVQPRSPYGASKAAAELLGFAFYHTYRLPFIACRMFNAYGPRQRQNVMYDLLHKLRENPEVLEVLGTGQEVRDYVYVQDVARAIVQTTECDEAVGQLFNLASGHPTTVAEVVDALVSALGIAPAIEYTGRSWQGDVKRLVGDPSKLSEVVGFRPEVPLEAGVALLARWFLQTHGAGALPVSV